MPAPFPITSRRARRLPARLSAALLSLFIILALPLHAPATVEWNEYKTLSIDGTPIDMATTSNGQYMFVLTDRSEVLIYTVRGTLVDRITLGKAADAIDTSPRGDALILSNREQKTVRIILLQFIKNIDVTGSPFKGPENAPIVIAVYTDFQ